MTDFIVMIVIFMLGLFIGIATNEDLTQDRCVAKYADMPHNKVAEHCKNIIKFDKD